MDQEVSGEGPATGIALSFSHQPSKGSSLGTICLWSWSQTWQGRAASPRWRWWSGLGCRAATILAYFSP